MHSSWATMVKTKTLKTARELKTMMPPPMNTMLEKQKSEAVKKWEDREQMQVNRCTSFNTR